MGGKCPVGKPASDCSGQVKIDTYSAEQALLGDFPQAIDDAVLESSEAHQEMMVQYLSNPELARGFARVVFDLLRQ